jgi:hypothetical protein
MMGMGSDQKKLGSMLLALSVPKEKEMEKEDEFTAMVKLTAKRVMQAIKENDVEMFISELPKLLNNLPQPEVEFEND